MTQKTTRRASREHAVQLIYEYAFNRHKTPAEIMSSAINYREAEFSLTTKEFFTGMCENLDKIDAVIEKSADNWRISRISRVSAAVLRLAVYELLTEKIDLQIIINEALELTRLFADETEVAFVNGVLSKAVIILGENK